MTPVKSPCYLIALFMASVACHAGDDGDGEANQDSANARDAELPRDASGADSAALPEGGADGGPADSACTGCAANEGCLEVNVELAAGSSDLPWKLFPEQSNGAGRLFAGVYSAGLPTRSVFVDGVDLRSGFSGRALELCAPAASGTAFCFLDDEADDMMIDPGGQLRGSSDFRDTCASQRAIPVTVRAGESAELTCSLSASCD